MLTRARVAGMTTQHCVRAVFTSLAAVEGIASADVRMGVVEVEHDATVTVDALRAALEVAGYSLVEVETGRSPLSVLPEFE